MTQLEQVPAPQPFVANRTAQTAAEQLHTGELTDQQSISQAIDEVRDYLGVPYVRSALAKVAGIVRDVDNENGLFFELVTTPQISITTRGHVSELLHIERAGGKPTTVEKALSLLIGSRLDLSYDLNHDFRTGDQTELIGAAGNGG